VVGTAALDPFAGDLHADSLFHYVMALDPSSEPIREIGDIFSGELLDLGVNPISWLGGTLAFYVDQDEIWEDIATAGGIEEALENAYLELNDLPVVVYFSVSSPLKLATFLTAVRKLIEETAPEIVEWESRTRGDHKYVCITGDETVDDIALYYATLPEHFVLSLNEDALLRAVERLKARDAATEAGDEVAENALEPWVGRSLAVSVDRNGIHAFQLLFGEDAHETTRNLSWSNLPILNEWTRRFPDRDPVEVHEALWGERLLCPAGGTYVWNEEWQTMESTVCGHPGRPGTDVDWPAILAALQRARAGITFELDGLRAIVELTRDS